MSINTLSANPIVNQEASALKYSASVVLIGGSQNQISILDGNNGLVAQVINGIKKNKAFTVVVGLVLPSGCTAGATASTCQLTVNGQAYATQTGSAVVGTFQNNVWTFSAVSLVDNPTLNIILGCTGGFFNAGVANCFGSAQIFQ
jgi:hypothetical protein